MSSVKAHKPAKSAPSQVNFPKTELEKASIRFAGDSGDGMQLTGNRFSATSVMAGSDVITFPDYPAEIRAPAGTLAGVSGFDLSISSNEIYTTADFLNVLIVKIIRKVGKLLWKKGSQFFKVNKIYSGL